MQYFPPLLGLSNTKHPPSIMYKNLYAAKGFARYWNFSQNLGNMYFYGGEKSLTFTNFPLTRHIYHTLKNVGFLYGRDGSKLCFFITNLHLKRRDRLICSLLCGKEEIVLKNSFHGKNFCGTFLRKHNLIWIKNCIHIL